MSFRLYVGNYPSEFSRKDVAHVFRKFDGIQVDKWFKKEKKSYSFLICKDIDQLVSVIQEMNNAIVSGRKLIVRASDESLQKYVELLLKESNDLSKNSCNVTSDSLKTPRKLNFKSNSPGLLEEKTAVNSVKTQENVDKRHFVKDCEKTAKSYDKIEQSYIKTKSYLKAKGNYERSPGYHDETLQLIPLQVLRNKTMNQNISDKNFHEQSEVYSCCSSSPSSVKNFKEHSPKIEYGSEFKAVTPSRKSINNSEFNAVTPSNSSNSSFDKHEDDDYDDSEFTWVSVTNFPLGTTVRSIYNLFCDYDPLDVRMICNEARRDKTLTEALVCFLNRDVADDVILNFDNTMFRGRLILVNDTEDLTVMNELLDVLPS